MCKFYKLLDGVVTVALSGVLLFVGTAMTVATIQALGWSESPQTAPITIAHELHPTQAPSPTGIPYGHGRELSPEATEGDRRQLSVIIAPETEPETTPTEPETVPETEPETEPEPAYTADDLEILAIIIYQEAGSDSCSDLTRLRVGCVFLNRVESDRYPDTFAEVATQRAQYGRLHWTGIQWPKRADNPNEAYAVDRAYEIARRCLEGERVLPQDVVYQAEFPQGSETVAESGGFYFCR